MRFLLLAFNGRWWRVALVSGEEVEQFRSCEDVRVGDVANVGPVEEVVVAAELEAGAAVAGGFHHIGHGGYVALAEDAAGAEGAGQEAVAGGGGWAEVVGEDDCFCFCLGWCISGRSDWLGMQD